MLRSLTILSALIFSSLSIVAKDHRSNPLKDLNGYFPFTPPTSIENWEQRKAQVKQRLQLSLGLLPMPEKTELNPVLHGQIDQGSYTIDKVYFQSMPGVFVTGNLYRPKKLSGKAPVVLFTHGHRTNARFYLADDASIKSNIEIGAEKHTENAKSVYQSMCQHLVSLGCIVWQWDMLSDSDAQQLSPEIVHKFAQERPDFDQAEHYGFYSTQAEMQAQSIMGLQTYNALRSVDFVLSLPDVDPTRIAITGASGGGTQAMIATALDDRITLSFPVVMVSTAMQGGCTCENASLLRIGTGNVEFAALCAPRPQGMNTANDWTKEMATKGFPELQALYQLLGHSNLVYLLRGEQYPHAYNVHSREAFYRFINQHFQLGHSAEHLQETTPKLLDSSQLTVWNTEHPAPSLKDTDFESQVLQWWKRSTHKTLKANLADQTPHQILKPILQTIVGRSDTELGKLTWQATEPEQDIHGIKSQNLILQVTQHHEQVKVKSLKSAKPNGQALIWLNENGIQGIFDSNQHIVDELQSYLNSGFDIYAVDLFGQDLGYDQKTATVDNPRQVPAYTHGYNHSLFIQRCHDVMAIIQALQTPITTNSTNYQQVHLAAWQRTAPIALCARAMMGERVTKAAIDLNGFRFQNIKSTRNSMFVPAIARVLDIEGLAALNAPHPLWIHDPMTLPLVTSTYQNFRQSQQFQHLSQTSDKLFPHVLTWLCEK